MKHTSEKSNSHRVQFLIIVLSLIFSSSFAQELPSRLIVGYWHNWANSPNSLLLTEIPEAYDVINIAFAVPSEQFGADMQFSPDISIYPEEQDFLDDIATLQDLGKKVLISLGGATAIVNVADSSDVEDFVSSMTELIDYYNFDGIDIDLEASSLMLEVGDTDFRDPTSDLIVYFIDAVQQLLDTYPEDLILTAAPETAYVQGGYSAYSSVWGAYLPVIHAFRDQLTYIHVQHYNTGSMFGRDGLVYDPATADFHVAMADMLLAGFNVNANFDPIFFDPLDEAQVLIGLPASPLAAGSGYSEPDIVHEAVTYLVTGEGFGGSYNLSNPDGFPAFRGLMTWSINWDVDNDLEFSNSHREFLDSFENPQLPPGNFELLTPANGDTLSIDELYDVHFSWTGSVDPNEDDTVSYNFFLRVSDSTEFIIEEYYQDFIAESLTINLADSLGDITWFHYLRSEWSVNAISGIDTTGCDEPFQFYIEPHEINDISEELGNLPSSINLFDIYPNPFNSQVIVRLSLVQKSDILITLYDILGRKVGTLFSGTLEPGYSELILDNNQLSSGLYFIELKSNSGNPVREKIVHIR